MKGHSTPQACAPDNVIGDLLENRVIMITAILLPACFLKGPIDSFTFFI